MLNLLNPSLYYNRLGQTVNRTKCKTRSEWLNLLRLPTARCRLTSESFWSADVSWNTSMSSNLARCKTYFKVAWNWSILCFLVAGRSGFNRLLIWYCAMHHGIAILLWCFCILRTSRVGLRFPGLHYPAAFAWIESRDRSKLFGGAYGLLCPERWHQLLNWSEARRSRVTCGSRRSVMA